MVGKEVGIFTAIEVKSEGGKMTPQQKLFLKTIEDNGGIGICVDSMDDYAKKLEEKINEIKEQN